MPDKLPMSILIVDDDPDARAIFRLVMNHHRLSATIVDNGEDALEYLQTHNPNIAIIDIFLPGLDGFHLLKQIQNASLALNSRFIATTAYYTSDTEHEAYERGFHGFIKKPYDSAQLVPYLEQVLNSG